MLIEAELRIGVATSLPINGFQIMTSSFTLLILLYAQAIIFTGFVIYFKTESSLLFIGSAYVFLQKNYKFMNPNDVIFSKWCRRIF